MFLIKCYYIIKSLLSFNKDHLIFRLLFTCYYFYKYRKLLKRCLIPAHDSSSLNDKEQVVMDFNVEQLKLLELNSLKAKGFKTLILDYDGVLNCYGALQPLPEIINWLEQAVIVFGAKRIFILSNNPSLSRKEFFDKHFNDNIIFVISKPKPYTDGIEYTKEYLLTEFKETPLQSEILLIDDRIATGILSAKIEGIASCLILKPYVDINKKFIVEVLFVVLRKFERLILCHL